MAVKETDFAGRLKREFPDWELLGEYVNAKTKVLVRHKKCGREYMKTPYAIVSKPYSCQFCNAKRLMLSQSEFDERAKKKESHYKVLSPYKGAGQKITVKHLDCGHVYEQFPKVFIDSEEGCPKCIGKTISKKVMWGNKEFLDKIKDRLDEYEILSEYKGAHVPIKVRHKCGNEWEITPDSFIRGGMCRRCRYSVGEGEVRRVIEELIDNEVIQGNRSILPNKFELDIVIPELKLAIEYDGLAYHTVEHFMADKNRKWDYAKSARFHSWKTEEGYKKGYRVIHIFEDEWLEHRDIVEDKLRAILKIPPERRFFARKLDVKRIAHKDAKPFLDANHIQGDARASVIVGLYSGEELVAVQSFSRARAGSGYSKNIKTDQWEIVRYATLLGCQVVGGFSKCLKWFERNYSPDEVVSCMDKRWGDRDNNVYLANGFEVYRASRPNYWYTKSQKRYHKSNFSKSKIKKKFPQIYDPNMTEKEMMSLAKYKRVYDCGLIKYIKRF